MRFLQRNNNFFEWRSRSSSTHTHTQQYVIYVYLCVEHSLDSQSSTQPAEMDASMRISDQNGQKKTLKNLIPVLGFLECRKNYVRILKMLKIEEGNKEKNKLFEVIF